MENNHEFKKSNSIFYCLLKEFKSNSSDDQKNKGLNFNFKNKNELEVKKELFKIGINLKNINFKKTTLNNYEKYFGLINIDYKNQYCLINKIKNKFLIKTDDKEFFINEENFNDLNFIKIWRIEKIKKEIFEDHNIFNKIKLSYILLTFSLSLISFLLIILGNLYLKIIIQNIIPEKTLFEFIFLSCFFLFIFLLNLFIELILKIYKNKNINKLSVEYSNFIFDIFLNGSNNLISKDSPEEMILNLKSISPIIEKKYLA